MGKPLFEPFNGPGVRKEWNRRPGRHTGWKLAGVAAAGLALGAFTGYHLGINRLIQWERGRVAEAVRTFAPVPGTFEGRQVVGGQVARLGLNPGIIELVGGHARKNSLPLDVALTALSPHNIVRGPAGYYIPSADISSLAKRLSKDHGTPYNRALGFLKGLNETRFREFLRQNALRGVSPRPSLDALRAIADRWTLSADSAHTVHNLGRKQAPLERFGPGTR